MDAHLIPAARISGRARHRSWWVVAIAVVVMLVAAACSGSAERLQTVGSAVGNSGGGEFSAAGAPAMASAAPSAAAAPDLGRDALGTKGGDTTGQNAPADTAYIIKTGSLTIEVNAIDDALDRAQAAIVGLGGYVSGSQRANSGENATASVTYRIPAARWDDAVAALHKIATKIVSEQTGAVEVTGQVLDLGARISNLQVTEAALQGIMARATKIPDVLAVEQQLSDVQGQIEQLSTEKKHLEDQAALGTLTVTFGLHQVAVAAVTHDWNPGSEIDRAVASLVGIGQNLIVAGVWFGIVWLPVLLGLAILAVLGWLVIRRLGLLRRHPSAPAPILPSAPES